MRIPAPNYTQTPNDLFDHWLPLLSEAELKVFLVIIRKTFGWHKTKDEISISQLEKATGMLRETVIKAANSLQSKGAIKKEVVGPNGAQRTIYEIVIEEDSKNSYQSDKPTPPVGLDLLGSTDPQKKPLIKETIQKKQQQQAAPPPVPAAPAAAAVEKINSDSIEYTTPSGQKKHVSEKEIYSHFLKKEIETSIIQKAINVIKQKKEPIGNVFKLLEVLCLQLAEKPKNFKTATKNEKISNAPAFNNNPVKVGIFL